MNAFRTYLCLLLVYLHASKIYLPINVSELREMNGSVALITGAGQGLGLAFAEVLAKNGAYVSILDINEDFGNKAVDRLKDKYKVCADSILFVKCDVTNKDEFEDGFQKTINKFGKLNIVINNAGVMTKYVTSWEQAIDLNYKAVVRGTILGLKYIENKIDENSAVINIGSITGLSNSILPIYQSTKRAVIEFTKSIGFLKMEIAADEAKLALDVIGDSSSRRKLGQTRTIENRLKNLCLKLRANKNSVLEFLNSCPSNSKANGNNIRVMVICPGLTFDGFENNIDGKKHLEQKLKTVITAGDDNPNPNRIILIQSTEYIKTALLHVMKNGKTGDVWIAENEESPRLSNESSQY